MTKRGCILRHAYVPGDAHIQKNIDALTDAGFEVDVICLREEGARPVEAHRGGIIRRLPIRHRRGGPLRYLFEYTAFLLMAGALLTWRSLRRRYDIVEVYNLPDSLVFAALPARILGSKIVFYMFELMPEQVADELRIDHDRITFRLLLAVERAATRLAHRVIVVSPYDRDVVVSRAGPQAEPTVIMNVPDGRLFARQEQRNGHDGPFRVLTHGSVLRRYGIQTLVRALPYLRAEIPDIEVVVLGDGEYRRQLEALACGLRVVDCVRFADAIPHEDVPAAISSANVGVVAAPVPWLLPNKLFEYVATGTPVVAASSPSLEAVFPDDALAYFTPDDERNLAERIIELYRAPARARTLTSNALGAYEPYRWTTMRRRYIQLHEELLGDTTSATASTEAAR